MSVLDGFRAISSVLELALIFLEHEGPLFGVPPLTLYDSMNKIITARFSVSGCAICNPLARGEWVGGKLIHVAGLYEAS